MGRTPENLRQGSSLEMPEPQYLDIVNPFKSGDRPIGIIARSPLSKKMGKFVWIRNFTGYSLTDGFKLAVRERRREVTQYVTRLTLTMGAEIIVGPAIDIKKCDSNTGKITVLSGSCSRTSYGYYLEFPERSLPNLRFRADTVDELRDRCCEQDCPELYDRVYSRVESSLPRR
jgi:hypothetical protein